MVRRALLIGGSGQLGSELQRQAPAGWDITVPTRAKLDAFDPDALARAVEGLKPALVLNCSAFHVVDLCESQFAEALAVNAVAVSALAKTCQQIGARFVTISTDYAFDGVARIPYRESDAANPIQAYGISKVAGERAALAAHGDNTLVIRSCGLYGLAASRQKSGNFVLNRLADLKAKMVVEVGSDLICTPTSASDLAGGIWGLLEKDVPSGLYHLTNGGACNWASFTAEIGRLAGSSARVLPIDRGGRYAPARRPAYSVLDGAKAGEVGVTLRAWQDALAEFVVAFN